MANKRERLGFARTLSAARELYAHTLVDVLAQVEHGALFLVLRLPEPIALQGLH